MLLLSGTVSIMAKPAKILPFSPSQSAAAVCGEWKRMLHPFSGSFESVAKVHPYFSSSRQAFIYSEIRSFFTVISSSSSTSSPFSPTNPSNIDLPARTSTVFAPQAHPISSPFIPSGRAMPRFTSASAIFPS